MFINTLGLKSDSKITTFVKSKVLNCGIPNFTTFKGKYVRKSSITIRQQIIDHVNSFNPQITHYTYMHAPNRRYLDCVD